MSQPPELYPARALHELISKLVDGTINASEHSDLQERLRDDASAQQAYFDYLDLDSDLRQMTHSGAVSSGNGLWILPVLGVMAALLALGAAIWWWSSSVSVVPTLAAPLANEVLLLQSSGGQFFRDPMPSSGQAMDRNHEYALTSGLIELRFPDGTQVIVEGPSVIELDNLHRLIVRQGTCSVFTPFGAEGFKVITPRTEVANVGPRFLVKVDEGGEATVQVIESALAAGPKHYRDQLPDRILNFRVGSTAGISNGSLDEVSVQRGGHTFHYAVADLIGVRIEHFQGGSNTHHLTVATDASVDAASSRQEVLESDRLLHTGVINLGGSPDPIDRDPSLREREGQATTQGMAIRFLSPVRNDSGPDVLFFELQSVVGASEGDAFRVSPLHFVPGLRSLTINRYDIALNATEAKLIPDFDLLQFKSNVLSLDSLLTGDCVRRNPAIPFWAIAVTIDLSDLGYLPGSDVDGLFFQDAMDDDQSVDPVFIAGLPPLPTAAEGTSLP